MRLIANATSVSMPACVISHTNAPSRTPSPLIPMGTIITQNTSGTTTR